MPTASNRSIVIACAGFAAGAGALALFGFGPLDPPNGPISPTYKTMSEVEPRTAINAANTPGDADSKFKITKPGSYYLTGNLTGVSGKSGIEVTANCTIDLCGFEMTGVNGSLDGILLVGEFRGTVRNGQIIGWGGSGIAGVECNGCLFEDLYLDTNSYGIWVGRDSILSRVRASSNTYTGILVDAYCTIVDCVGSGCGGVGIDAGSYSTVSRCNVRNNALEGIDAAVGGNISDCVVVSNYDGITARGGIVRDNVCDSNGSTGIYLTGGGGTLASNNSCNDNGGFGIYCDGGPNHIEANFVRSSEYGIRLPVNGGNLMVRNYAAGNAINAYFDPGGNNTGQILYGPGYFTEANSWANISGN